MFGIGMPELLLILAIALIVIGPKKLPDLAKSLGRAMREFKRATSDFKESLELDDDLKDVKSAFDDLQGNMKDPLNVGGDDRQNESKAEKRQKDLESAYDAWKKDHPNEAAEPDSEPAADTSAEKEPPVSDDPAGNDDPPTSDTQESLKNG